MMLAPTTTGGCVAGWFRGWKEGYLLIGIIERGSEVEVLATVS